MNIPFSIYDIFGYLISGLLLLFGLDYAFNLGWILNRELGAQAWTAWVLIAYLIGHVNAAWASWCIEKMIVGKTLGYPTKNLFSEKKAKGFSHYREPLDKNLASGIKKKFSQMTKTEFDLKGHYPFLFCYHQVKDRCPNAYARIGIFLNLYGFTRNLSFALTTLGLVFVASALITKNLGNLGIGISAFVGAMTFFYRYLKFFRLHAVEVFTSFLTSVDLDSNPLT